VFPLPSTSISFSTGVECFLAQTGSASIGIGLSLGAVPANVTVPVIDAPAPYATPGHAAAIVKVAARDIRVAAVKRIVVSFENECRF
jgi:hypothetical protein